MRTNNVERVIVQSNVYIANINWFFKGIKSEVSADYICMDNRGIIVMTNKVVVFSDLNIVEKYMKKLNNVDKNNVISSKLLQLKYYLEILGISYFIEDTNLPITSDIIERVIKSSHIFDDIVLTSQPQVIKASPKCDMTVIWIDIWDFQNGTKVKLLINRCFDIRQYIAMIRKMNMNPNIL